MATARTTRSDSLRIAALFAGIGGIEVGLHAAGHETVVLCEWDAAARRVLDVRFPKIPLIGDVAEIVSLPEVDLVTAGFPCQDLSQAGRTAGIRGHRSGLVEHVFRLLDSAAHESRWLLLENVSFMLSLDRGEAMRWLTAQLEARGYTWAYRVVDTQAFGLPQRRQRVILLASLVADPRPVLLNQEHGKIAIEDRRGLACGFYWTEGIRGLGWAIDALPTLKGGSTIGIPSPPAMWRPGTGRIVTPEIRDAERLQGFEPRWTEPADEISGRRRSDRWKLVGNAVSTPVAKWVGERLRTDEPYEAAGDVDLAAAGRWPSAAWGRSGERRAVPRSMWPVAYSRRHLHEFFEYEPNLLSARATAGFLSRTARGNLRIPEDLIAECRVHLDAMTPQRRLEAA
jgi:DNA (cytosine-5)-methyltransferase 1